MESVEDRQSLITHLLSQAGTVEQLITLVKLLQSWPDPLWVSADNPTFSACMLHTKWLPSCCCSCHRASHIASWGCLLVQLALQPHGRGYVLHVRAGLEGIPLDVSVHLCNQENYTVFIRLINNCMNCWKVICSLLSRFQSSQDMMSY